MTLDLADVPSELDVPVRAALSAAGVTEGHLSATLVSPAEIRRLNADHRNRDEATDVLAFPLDEGADVPGPRELGDVVICPELCESVAEAAVHGVLHLCGYDHEQDSGEMLALQMRAMSSIGTGNREGQS
ncbi:MAG: rRNA maturation RNase YbeY [Solirubrobacterales bacterium]